MTSQHELTVLITAAGHGRRMGTFSNLVNKSLVPYNNRPLISHIFDRFDPNTQFVIAIGHLGYQVQDYVSLVHPDKNVEFVNIPDFDDNTTGPGTTIKYCAPQLPGAFMWVTCDTLFEFDYTGKLDHNWILVSEVDQHLSSDYCWVTRDGTSITSIHNKEHSNNSVDAFIGVMYMCDSAYISQLETKEAVLGFLPALNIKAYEANKWQDFGTYDKWEFYNTNVLNLPKVDEILYIDNHKVVKFSNDIKSSQIKYNRALLHSSIMPENIAYSGNFLSYDYVVGSTVYNDLTIDVFATFLSWAETHVWTPVNTSPTSYDVADTFYRVKTFNRLDKFRQKYPTWAENSFVNSCPVLSVDEYLSYIDFDKLSSHTVWAYIHGDLQFDNVIYNKVDNKFTLIDWRSDFAGEQYGDIYYDLGKLLAGLYLNHQDTRLSKFSYSSNSAECVIKIPMINNIDIFLDYLQQWVISRNLNWEKIVTLVPIIYLNMAPLHEAPYDMFLISLAQLFFSKLDNEFYKGVI
jgi:NDP-sugar pyrophosphorylase family protein